VVCLVSEPFVPMAEAEAEALEYSGARLVTFEHPLVGLDDQAVAEKADKMVDQVIDSFLGIE